MLKSVAMTETLDVYTSGTSPDDFAESDLPDDIAGDDTDGPPADWPTGKKFYGWTTDPATGERRLKNAPGRPRKHPGAEELAKAPEIVREPDQPPQRPPGRRPQPVTPAGENEPKMPRGGVIAAGVNKLYRRAGKLLRGLEGGDPMGFGQALIECARTDPDTPEDERELTVGEAWEQLAKANPRIRAFILRIIMGGDITDLVMAHAPIGIAFAMKPWVQRFIGPVIESMTEPDEDAEEGTDMPSGLTREDLQQMSDLTDDQARRMAQKAREMATRAGVHLSDNEIQSAVAKAASMQDGVPPAFRRQQPKSRSRAQRTGAK